MPSTAIGENGTSIVHVPPSAESATQLVRGEPWALFRCVGHTALRTALIAGGMSAVCGYRQPNLWKNALGGALALEALMLLYARHRERHG